MKKRKKSAKGRLEQLKKQKEKERQQAYQRGYAYEIGKRQARQQQDEIVEQPKKKVLDIWTGQWVEVE